MVGDFRYPRCDVACAAYADYFRRPLPNVRGRSHHFARSLHFILVSLARRTARFSSAATSERCAVAGSLRSWQLVALVAVRGQGLAFCFCVFFGALIDLVPGFSAQGYPTMF